MIHSLTMFLAPQACQQQATTVSPPAPEPPADASRLCRRASLRFMAGIAGNAIGFGVLLAGCWFSLQLIQYAVSP
jgi:hypothetical protein